MVHLKRFLLSSYMCPLVYTSRSSNGAYALPSREIMAWLIACSFSMYRIATFYLRMLLA